MFKRFSLNKQTKFKKYKKFLFFRQVFSWDINSFLSFGMKSFIFGNIKHFFRVGFFHYLSSESFPLLKYKKIPFRSFCFPKYKISFLFKKYKKFINIRDRKFHSPKYKDFFSIRAFFIFSSLGLKVAPVTTFRMFWIYMKEVLGFSAFAIDFVTSLFF